MIPQISNRLHGFLIVGSLLLGGCAGYDGSDLKPGVATRADLSASMGQPAMAWQDPDGSEQLAYPRGPAGTQTFMAYLGPDGRLQRIEAVLTRANFAKIGEGLSQQQVLRIIGPSGPRWTETFALSHRLAWSWLTCADGNFQEYFDVMFDLSSGLVVATGYHPVLTSRGGPPDCAQERVRVSG